MARGLLDAGMPSDMSLGQCTAYTREATPTVLLLDGDPRNARLLSGLLGADGYRVEVCRSGAAALVRLHEGPAPAAVILDLSPARTRELAVVRTICERRPELALLVITADPRLARPLAAATPDRVQIFVKPLDYCALVRALGPACTRLSPAIALW